MTTPISQVFATRFGMYVPCDRAACKKLKRLRHLATFAEAMARRWSRAQRRLPKNRHFRRGRVSRPVTDAMLFIPFWHPRPVTPPIGMTLPVVSAAPTPLLETLMADYRNARSPVASAENVRPLILAADELDALLAALAMWHEQVFVPW
jgi:hypothetical protein